MKHRNLPLAYTGSSLSFSNSKEGKLLVHQVQDTISTQSSSLKRIVLVCRWPQCTSTHREKQHQEEDERRRHAASIVCLCMVCDNQLLSIVSWTHGIIVLACCHVFCVLLLHDCWPMRGMGIWWLKSTKIPCV